MRKALALFLGGISGIFSIGCTIHEYHDAPPPRREVVVEEPPPAPIVEGPGVEVIEVEPPPAQRVYVYEEGYPPGVYFYNNYYWYGGYRYEHDVFINRYVTVNIRERRYVNVVENRRVGQRIEETHRTQYVVNHGVRPARDPYMHPVANGNSNPSYKPEHRVEAPERRPIEPHNPPPPHHKPEENDPHER